MKNRNNRYGIILVFFIIFCALSFSYSKLIVNSDKYTIKMILSTSDYSYLSDTVKSYIEQRYYETGVVLKTEKNKTSEEYYLNPKYIEYLDSLNSLNKDDFNYDVIPDEVIIDYVYSGDYDLESDNTLPSKFDLRNVNGKNYVTPIKDQNSTGLCWSFATNAQAESHLLVKSGKSYQKGVSQLFSEMQIDYATAENGVVDGKAKYSFNRILSDGGTFSYVTTVMKDGLGLVDVSWRDFNTYDEKSMEMNRIYNYSNSKYDLLSTVDYPFLNLNQLDLSVSSDATKRENYLNDLKRLIMENGGAYVSTADPSGKCAIKVNGSYMIYDDNICNSAGHAMQIIGWDDDFEYSFCSGKKNASGMYYIDNSGTCTTGNIIAGKGAWIMKNSWGEDGLYDYPYLAYDSMNSHYNIITNIVERDWDNNYEVSGKLGSYTYKSEHSNTEKLNKIKFKSTGQNTTVDVCVKEDASLIKKCKQVVIDFPGIYTVDFSDDNILITDQLVVSSTRYNFNSINVYTNNVSSLSYASTEDVIFENKITNIDKYSFRITTKTNSIPVNSFLDYKILDQNRKEITSEYTYSENIVYANEAFTKLYIDNDLELGEYILQTIYNGNVLCESKLVVNVKNITTLGSGSMDDPYIITTPAHLDLIRLDRFAYYKLGNDIDLTYDTQNVDGLFYNDGKGFEPIKYSSVSWYKDIVSFNRGFSGGFDGNNHKIIGLYINRPDENSVGLFANIYNENFSDLYIKNVILENPTIIGGDFVGSLLGYINGTTYERNSAVFNISVIGGNVSGNKYVGGVIGLINAGSKFKKYGTNLNRHNYSNLYNSATVNSDDYSGGIVGYITNIDVYTEGYSPVELSNVLNKGKITSLGNAGGLVGFIKARNNESITINNSINTGIVLGNICSSNIVCEFSKDSIGKLYLNNIHYLTTENLEFNSNKVTIDNVSKMNFDEMKVKENFDSWNTFNDYWKIETIDGITRLPVLKFLNFDYMSFDNIIVDNGESLNLKEYINSKYDYVLNNIYYIYDENIINISSDNIISGLSVGETKFHVLSYYDGYDKYIYVTVLKSDKYKITYYLDNSLNSSKYIQFVDGKNIVILDKNKFTREGYEFTNWNTKVDGTGKSYFDQEEVTLTGDLILYAQWKELVTHIINKYSVDKTNNYIDLIDINTTISEFKNNVTLASGYTLDVDTKNVNGKDVVYTGGKTKIYNGDILYIEYTNIVLGDADGDGKLGYTDYVKIYNHIYKTKNPASDKKLLVNEYLLSADYLRDDNINYQDYVKVYNKIKELKK